MRGCTDAQAASWPKRSVACLCVYCWIHFCVPQCQCPTPQLKAAYVFVLCTHATVSVLILSQSEGSRPITKATILHCKHTHTHTHRHAHEAVTLHSPVNSLQCLLFPLCRHRPKRQCCVQLIPLFRLCWRPLATTLHRVSRVRKNVSFVCLFEYVTHNKDPLFTPPTLH